MSYHTSKLSVEQYKANVIGTFVCSCYTHGAPLSMEREYLVKKVSYAELRAHYIATGGTANIPDATAQQQLVQFVNFLNTAPKDRIAAMCAAIINEREGRTHYYSQHAA